MTWTPSRSSTTNLWLRSLRLLLFLLGPAAGVLIHSADVRQTEGRVEIYALAQATPLKTLPEANPNKRPSKPGDLEQKKKEGVAAETNNSTTLAGNEIEIGKMFEQDDRLDDAEKAYSKALETATGVEREEAKKCLLSLLKKKHGVRMKYWDPWIEKLQKNLSEILFGIIAGLVTILLFWLLKRSVSYFGSYWGKNKLHIGDFIDATTGHAALAIVETLKNAVEEVQEYYRPRDRFRFGSFNSLILVDSPESSELMEVVAAVIPGESNKVLAFITKGYRKPHYLITGIVQQTGSQYRLLVKLLRKGATIQIWDVTVPATRLHHAQGDLALDVVLNLKEVVEANAD